jgi:SAM-dependent methyltransferase
VSDPSSRFTEQWDAVDPFDEAYPHLWIKVEHLARYLFAADLLGDSGVKTVLDAGAGTGYGSRLLAERVETVVTLDAQNLIGICEENASFIQHSIGTSPIGDALPGARFDGIVCFETLEHLVDPGGALIEFGQIQPAGGTLILSVPNSVAERVGPDGLLTNPYHRRAFSISSIRSLLTAAGYEVREVLGQQLASDINSNETRLIRRKSLNGRIGDEPAFHQPSVIERLARVIGYPEPRDVERSYSLVVVAERATVD